MNTISTLMALSSDENDYVNRKENNRNVNYEHSLIAAISVSEFLKFSVKISLIKKINIFDHFSKFNFFLFVGERFSSQSKC